MDFALCQVLGLPFRAASARIFPNLLVQNYLMDCIALASFTHSHALVHETVLSFFDAIIRLSDRIGSTLALQCNISSTPSGQASIGSKPSSRLAGSGSYTVCR